MMTRWNHRSDLVLRESFYTRNIIGEPEKVPIAEGMDFRIEYHTRGEQRFVVSRIAGVYENCRLLDEATLLVCIPLSQNDLGKGMLCRKLTTIEPDDNFQKGTYEICIPTETGVELWDGPSDAPQFEISSLNFYPQSLSTLGGLLNVKDDADALPSEDILLIKRKKSAYWKIEPLSKILEAASSGLDTEALAEYLTANKYATQTWVNGQGYLTSHQSLAGYATEEWVQQQGYLTDHQLLAEYAKKADLAAKLDKSIFEDFFTKENIGTEAAPVWMIRTKYGFSSDRFVSSKGAPNGEGEGSGGVSTLGQLVNVDDGADASATYDRVFVRPAGATHWTTRRLSDIVGLDTEALAQYLTANKYATQTWVTQQGYLTSHQSLAEYAKKADLAAKLDKSIFEDFFTKENIGTEAAPVWMIRTKYGFSSDRFVSSKGAPDDEGEGSGGVSTLGQLVNVDNGADASATYDRVFVRPAGATHWTTKRLSDIVGLDTEALAQYLTANKYATQTWVTQQGYLTSHQSLAEYAKKADLAAKLDKAIFEDFFTKENIGTEAAPVWMIRTKYGFSSDRFVSSKGPSSNEGGGVIGATALSQLTDVLLTAAKAGDVLQYNGSKWTNVAMSAIKPDLAGYATQEWAKENFVKSVGPSGDYLAIVKGDDTTTWVIPPRATRADGVRDVTLRRGSANVNFSNDGQLRHFFASSSMTEGKPMGDGHIIHMEWDNSLSWAGQLFLPNASSASMQWRTQPGSTWGGWRTLLDESNYAATLDGRYLKKAGDTLTGTLTAKVDQFLAYGAAGIDMNNSDITRINGLWFADVYNSAGEAINFYVDGSVWSRLGASGGVLYFHPSIGTSAHAFGHKVWHEGNDGAGSGLDADLLDGLHAEAFARCDQWQQVDLNSVNGFGFMMNKTSADATTDRHYPINEAGLLIYGTAAYSSANQIYGTFNSNRWFARGGGGSPTSKTGWREFAFLDSTVANADKLGGRLASWYYNETTIDVSALDQNTWYPVSINVATTHRTHIELQVALNSGTKPSWSTHNSGFSVSVVWDVNGAGWGTIPLQRIVHTAAYSFASTWPVGGITQLTNSSNEIIYVRGGGKYFFKTNRGVVPELHTSSWTVSSQTVAPTTTQPAVPYIGQGIVAEKMASGRRIWGQLFNGTADIPETSWAKMRYTTFTQLDGGNAGYIGCGASNNDNIYLVAYGEKSIYINTNGASNDFVLTAGHRVGIGTASPAAKLHVNGATISNTIHVKFSGGGNYNEGIRLYGATKDSCWSNVQFGCDPAADGGVHANQWSLGRDGGNNFVLKVGGTSNNAMSWMKDGKVGIGIAIPTQRLDVDGHIRANGWLYSNGDTGWFNQTYGGGWYMRNSTYIENYGSKRIKLSGINDYYALWLTSGGICCEGYAGAAWNNGYGALNVGCVSNGSQTPLIVAYRNGGTTSSGYHVGASRLFAIELLNTGSVLHFAFGGASKFDYSSGGDFHATGGIWADRYVSSKGPSDSSDERLKYEFQQVQLAIGQIAAAPAVLYRWRDNGELDLGSIAQYWQRILDAGVRTNPDGYLGMSYDKIALVSAILLARHTLGVEQRVDDHETRIRKIEQKINRLTA